MALPNPSMSFSPFAILTAEEMNDLVENIEALADGSGLDDGAIGPAKTTLFRTQTDNANTIANAFTAGVRIQAGWVQVIGNSASSLDMTITFPQAFTTVLGVVGTGLGAKATTAAATVADFTTPFTIVNNCIVNAVSNTGATLTIVRTTGTYGNTSYYGVSWIAWGI